MIARSYRIIVLFLIPSRRASQGFKHITVLLFIAFIAFLLYGVISNTLMATVLFYGVGDSTYSHAFVLIALKLIISYLMTFLPQLIVVLSEILQIASVRTKFKEKFFEVCVL
uniref:Uncharacterized protein n=1 Tax=Onchocerca volvulus TaxID=6282 RepID=A0A8R1U2H9_ONCVO